MKTEETSQNDVISEAQKSIREIEKELHSYSALLKALGEKEIQGQRLQGLGIALERIATNLEKANDQIDSAYNKLIF